MERGEREGGREGESSLEGTLKLPECADGEIGKGRERGRERRGEGEGEGEREGAPWREH